MSAPHTRDSFLGGRVTLEQPPHGYRAGVDAVLLAASVPARPGDTVLELGCGAGAAVLCLAARVPGLRLAAIERQPAMADLAARNAALNGHALEVHCGDLAAMPEPLRQRQFAHVLANPPYFDRASSLAGPDAAREAARSQDTPLAAWIDAAARRLAPRGYLSLVHRPEALPALLAALEGRLGSVQVQPLAPREGRDAHLILLRARKDGRAPLRLHGPLILHPGASHEDDGGGYTPRAAAALTGASALRFGDE